MSTTLGRSASILVADDDQEIRKALCDLLSSVHDCRAVGTAEAALAQLRLASADLVISDIKMGGTSGLDLIPQIRKLAPDAVVIMISGGQKIESAVEALRAGAFDYVTKPFDLQHVETAVNRALEHQQLLAAKHRYETFLEQMVEQRTAELDRAVQSIEDTYRMTLSALTASLEMRDHETHGHSERVVSFSLRLGRELGLTGEELRALEFGALLHDIGKIGVPDAILRKPSALTESEWARMREHPLLGQKILRGVQFLEGAARVVAEHHEKWDGSGYPLGLKGEEIDLNARIFGVADAFDAMTSDRVYRHGRSYEQAARELVEFSGQQFDPRVVGAFLRVPREEWDEMARLALELRRTSSRTQKFDTASSNVLFKSKVSTLINQV
jgi:putative nucleotidyltransferase with HDIG domain